MQKNILAVLFRTKAVPCEEMLKRHLAAFLTRSAFSALQEMCQDKYYKKKLTWQDAFRKKATVD